MTRPVFLIKLLTCAASNLCMEYIEPIGRHCSSNTASDEKASTRLPVPRILTNTPIVLDELMANVCKREYTVRWSMERGINASSEYWYSNSTKKTPSLHTQTLYHKHEIQLAYHHDHVHRIDGWGSYRIQSYRAAMWQSRR